MPALVFCTSWCADFGFRGAQAAVVGEIGRGGSVGQISDLNCDSNKVIVLIREAA